MHAFTLAQSIVLTPSPGSPTVNLFEKNSEPPPVQPRPTLTKSSSTGHITTNSNNNNDIHPNHNSSNNIPHSVSGDTSSAKNPKKILTGIINAVFEN
jgi:hypothetical protein